MKYKNIRSVAHNIGHSFLSDLNTVGRGTSYLIVPELLFRAAEQERVPEVRLNLLTGEVQPATLALPPIQEAVGHYVRRLPELLTRQNVKPSVATAALLTISFDYSRRRQALYRPEVTIPEFACVVAITDDRGQTHLGRPANWWYT